MKDLPKSLPADLPDLAAILSAISAGRGAAKSPTRRKAGKGSEGSPFGDCSHLLLLDGSVNPDTGGMGIGIVAEERAGSAKRGAARTRIPADRPKESEPMSLAEFDAARKRGEIPGDAKIQVVSAK